MRTLLTLFILVSIWTQPTHTQEENPPRDVPLLKDVFSTHFMIGGALNRRVVAGKDPGAALLATKHFNTATVENSMKWQRIHPHPNQYNWHPADQFMAFCETNQLAPIGHCLVWHSQVPDWVFENAQGEALTRDEQLARMKDHITNVAGRYKGRIHGWDVVNEAFERDGSMRQTPWLEIIGEGNAEQRYDYIEHAFRWAHEADPQAELYYNDYSLETSKAKCDAVVALVKHLQSKGIRIDGVGIQLHGGLNYPSPEGLEYAITRLDATGVKVMITELDIRTQKSRYRGADVSRMNEENATDSVEHDAEIQKRLAEKYAEIFTILNKHRDVIPRVTFWGIYDGASWIGGSPLLFDRSYHPKQAFFAVVDSVNDSPTE